MTETLTMDRIGQELSEIYFDIDFVNRAPMLTVAEAIPEVLYCMTKCDLVEDVIPKHAKCRLDIVECRERFGWRICDRI